MEKVVEIVGKVKGMMVEIVVVIKFEIFGVFL